MHDVPQVGDAEAVDFLVRAALARPGTRLSLLTVPAPLGPLAALWDVATPSAVLWAAPRGRRLVGVGEALVVVASGPTRFAEVGAAAASLAACHVARHPAAAAPPPSLIGGFAFAAGGCGGAWQGFVDARFLLPRWTYEHHRGGRATLTLALAPGEEVGTGALAHEAAEIVQRLRRPLPPAPLPPCRVRSLPVDDWRRMVAGPLVEIAGGRLRKVVLARPFEVEAETPLPVAALLARLEVRGNGGYRFAFRVDGRTFLGATPELLVARRGRTVASEALAGSLAGEGATAAQLAAFMADPKQREEHALVVETISAGLSPLCEVLQVPARPRLRWSGTVAHLHTPMRGRLRKELSVAELAARLHPTPAVAGVPVGDACACIARCEAEPRGWYAGPVGVVTAAGDGTLAVALRGALVDGTGARLWSGAGFVAGSTAEGEFEETGFKARAALAALGFSP